MTRRKTTAAAKKAGRPKGSTNRPAAEIDAPKSRCPSCGSTDRLPYHRTVETPYPGADALGNPCTHVVRRWTRCAACGQHRIDKSYELRTSPPKPTMADPAATDATGETDVEK